MSGPSAAWDLVDVAAARAGVTVRPMTTLKDADTVARLIDAVWGEQVVPRELIRAFQHAGTVLYGAERDGDTIGFVLGFLGFEDGLHLHSHMLAVVPGSEDRGIGYALKLAQRAACLDHGVEQVRWTYDPLIARNARFNLAKLGAEATAFLPAFYGEMRDRLNRGDRSDRFEVRWRLTSPRVEAALAGERGEGTPVAAPVVLAVGPKGRPAPAVGLDVSHGAMIEIPRDHQTLKREDPPLAAAWRDAFAEAVTRCFDARLVATAFGSGAYVFLPPEP